MLFLTELLQMFIEQNKLKRQSHLLLQSSAPDQQLLKALDENAKLTQLLEKERIHHQQKVTLSSGVMMHGYLSYLFAMHSPPLK